MSDIKSVIAIGLVIIALFTLVGVALATPTAEQRTQRIQRIAFPNDGVICYVANQGISCVEMTQPRVRRPRN